ncbi:MAG: hypothetical protein J7604_01285 [Sporocytophaga sp.]|uniref:hypothetical protein n=1 Tax=Sporocytophaga sp. TaxID=2231183 RepID=UPI001B2EFA1B|nr:hypothetical protein [Sporocytophaga sp.]MBO9698806.1 hypothetical protein [Sporocytophaga sp.]
MKYLLGLIIALSWGFNSHAQTPQDNKDDEDSFICYQVDENSISCYSDYDPAFDETFQQGVTPEGDIYSMEENVIESPEQEEKISEESYQIEPLELEGTPQCEANKKEEAEVYNSPENYEDKSNDKISQIGDQERGENTVNAEVCNQLERSDGKSFGEPYDFEKAQCYCPDMETTTEGDYKFGNPDEEINPEDVHVETNISTDEGGIY